MSWNLKEPTWHTTPQDISRDTDSEWDWNNAQINSKKNFEGCLLAVIMKGSCSNNNDNTTNYF